MTNQPETQPGRDERGWFLPGHRNTSPGRPKVHSLAAYARATGHALSPTIWREVVTDAVHDARYHKDHQVRAESRRFLLDVLRHGFWAEKAPTPRKRENLDSEAEATDEMNEEPDPSPA
jgi:hypothetical protein